MNKRILSFLVALALLFGACVKDMELDEQTSLDEVIATEEAFAADEQNTLTEALETDEVIETAEESIVVLITDIAEYSSEKEYTVSYKGIASVVINGKVEYVTQFLLTDDDGNTLYAYCADMTVPCYEGAKYKLVSAGDYLKNGEETKIMTALTYIANVYGWMETSNPEGYMQLIQSVIWRIIHNCEINLVYNNDGEMIRNVINYIYNNINNLPKDYNASVTMEGTDIAVDDGAFINYGPYNVSDNVIWANVFFDLKFDMGGNNAKFVNAAGVEITQTKTGEAFYIRVPADVYGNFKFSASASVTKNTWSVNEFQLFNDVREGDYQPLFYPMIISAGTKTYFYSCSSSFSVSKNIEEEVETVILNNLNWNNGNCAGINSFDVNGVTLKHNKNYVTPANFDAIIAKKPDKNSNTAIFTVVERTVKNNGKYEKVYEIKVALYENGLWKVYGGTITVDNPGGNNNNQKIELERVL